MSKPPQLQNKTKKLTAKQKKFCHEYVKNFNATQAALNAGYSQRTAHSIGSFILTKVEIKAYLSKIQNKRLDENRAQAKEILDRTSELIQSNIVPILEAARTNSLNELPLSAQKSIRSVRYKKQITPDRHGNTEESESWMITLHDINKPLELMWRHLGLAMQDTEAIAALQTFGKVVKTPQGFTFEYADCGDDEDEDED